MSPPVTEAPIFNLIALLQLVMGGLKEFCTKNDSRTKCREMQVKIYIYMCVCVCIK